MAAVAATPPPVTFDTLVGQQDAVRFLRGVAARGRVGNAYLLHGPAGVGKGTAALAFARALLCERAAGAPAAQASLFDASTPEPAARAPGDPCSACAACAKTAALQHPDLKFLFPVSGEERELDDTVAQTLAAWREDPFFVFTYEKAASIRISMTREVLRELAYHPFEAGRRVVMVRDADRMREDQYSAMLKAIEEPGATTVWILTTSRPNRLPATIRSRTQRVRFRSLTDGEIEGVLTGRLGLPGPEARMLAALGSGSLGRALVLRDLAPLHARDEALGLLALGRRGDPALLWKAANSYGRAGRETLRRMIEFQELWLRDVLRARYGAPRESLVHRDREKEIRAEAERVDATEVRRRLMVLEDALRSIEGNIAADLALFSAMSRLADPNLGGGEWPRHDVARWEY